VKNINLSATNFTKPPPPFPPERQPWDMEINMTLLQDNTRPLPPIAIISKLKSTKSLKKKKVGHSENPEVK
jgi:hypothetical protein